MERGEVQGECVVFDTLARESYFKQGNVNTILQLRLQPDPRLPDVPMASLLAGNERDKQALNLFILRAAVGCPFVVGPGVPEERITALRDAFAASIKDLALLQEARRAGIHPRYVCAKQIAAVIAAVIAAAYAPEVAIEPLEHTYERRQLGASGNSLAVRRSAGQ